MHEDSHGDSLSEKRYDPDSLPVWENPAVVPRLQEIIKQARRPRRSERPTLSLSSAVSRIPLEVAIEIVERASARDARNKLAAFGWRLPDSYWQRCCNMELIFECADLLEQQKTTNCPVDWQDLGLAIVELIQNPKRERKTGLETRRWVFRNLEQIKTIFLGLLEDKTRL